MGTPLIEQQIYLLERYSSKEYFGLMRDAFKAMVKAGYAALDEFMLHLPRDYRSRELWEQPDIVWGERVLPNLSKTEMYVDMAWDKLEAGDFSGLDAANNVSNDFCAMSDGYSTEWMSEPFRSEFDAKWMLAARLNSGICDTVNRNVRFGSLYYPTWAEEKEDWDVYWEDFPPPKTWPIYRLNPDVQVYTDETVKHTGIYLPAADRSCPMFMYVGGFEAGEAGVDVEGKEVLQATRWTLVERVADEGGQVPGQESWRGDTGPNRCEGGKACPQEGNWWTPAADPGTGYFKKGDVMPNYPASTYGATIWYRVKE